MTYNELCKGRVSHVGMDSHVTSVTLNRTPFFISLPNERKVVRELMVLQAEGRTVALSSTMSASNCATSCI
jgi:hypothetical protein